VPARTRRNIAVVTGTRAEYGILRTVLGAVDAHPKLRLQLVVTGMHLVRKFGYTVDEIRDDGWRIDARVPMQTHVDNPTAQTHGLARGIAGLGRAFSVLDPDFVVVLGDRIEAFAAASAAVMCRRLLAHIHGGDVATGDIDDSLRHAITKLAHVHFPATQDAAQRIRRLGEDPWRIHTVGAPGMDELRKQLAKRTTPKFDAAEYAGDKEYALLLRHPCTRSPTEEEKRTAQLIDAVRAESLEPLIIYPNSDPGNSGIIRAIERAQKQGRARAFRSLPRDLYLSLLQNAEVLVGNSSSGIIESAFLGTPAVNVGLRQTGRLRASPAVIDAADSPSALRLAIRKARKLRPRAGTRTAYGDGRSGPRIARILAATKLTDRLAFKRITY
jgi:UDP-N-acetylglucosamine 2-epimerase (non-hydrolysing)/GDP/UDP-N,N'-diacetylbacillosamine 2-epimerase (hydrolysing)